MNAVTDDTLVLQHSYRCTPDALFDAWLDPATVQTFMCTETQTMGRLQWQATPGGEFLVEMTKGTEIIPHTGRFIEITRPRRIVFTWTSPFAGKDTLVTLDFADANGRTLLTLTHERLPAVQVNGHRGGWTSILGRLAVALDA